LARWIVLTVIRWVGGGVDLLRVQPGRVVEKACEGGVLVLLLGRLGGTAQ
jgi:hypothetical protein